MDPIIPSMEDDIHATGGSNDLYRGAYGSIKYKHPDWVYIRSKCWDLRIAFSSVCGMEVATSFVIASQIDLRNQSRRKGD